MKKAYLLLFSLASLFLTNAQAQGLKSAVLVGGSVNYDHQSSSKMNRETTSMFGLRPMVGYLLSDRWAVGLIGGYARAVTEREASTVSGTGFTSYIYPGLEVTSTTWEVGAFTRYYLPLTSKLMLFAQAGGVFGRTKSKVDTEYSYQGIITDGLSGRPAYVFTGTDYYRDANGNLILGSDGLPAVGYSSNSQDMDNYRVFLSPGLVFFPTPLLGIEVSTGEIAYNHNKSLDQKNFTANLNLSSIKLGLSFYLGRAKEATE